MPAVCAWSRFLTGRPATIALIGWDRLTPERIIAEIDWPRGMKNGSRAAEMISAHLRHSYTDYDRVIFESDDQRHRARVAIWREAKRRWPDIVLMWAAEMGSGPTEPREKAAGQPPAGEK